MSQTLWIAYDNPAKLFGPTRVSIQDCDYIDDFKDEIIKKFEISGPASHLSLYKSDGTTEIDVGDSPAAYLDGNRQGSTRKMAVEASCRKYLDAIARKISEFYEFDYNHIRGATMENVLAAKNGKQGKDWRFRLAIKNSIQIDDKGIQRVVKKGKPFTNCPLLKLFQPDEWEKIRMFNSITSQNIHPAGLPRLSDGRAYIIIPASMYSDEAVAFLKDIGVRSFLLSDPGALVVKNEDTVFESSFRD